MRSDAPAVPAGVGLVPVATLVLWAGCLAVGIAGLRLRYPRAPLQPPEPTPVYVQALNVDITNAPVPPPSEVPAAQPQAVAQPAPAAPPPPQAIPAPSAAPPLAAVATPSPAIAFAVPVEGPSRKVDAKQAAPVAAPPPKQTASAPVPAAQAPALNAPQRLTFGEGEGRQPAPEYPREAALAHQQGTVVVRFTVASDGRVRSAEASAPSPYALLNQAAVRAVRETWRFPRGPVRNYEVAIEFELKQH